MPDCFVEHSQYPIAEDNWLVAKLNVPINSKIPVLEIFFISFLAIFS